MYALELKKIINGIKIEIWHNIPDDYHEVWVDGKLYKYFCSLYKAYMCVRELIINIKEKNSNE